MKYGHFDNPAKEYLITNPQTPYPWINYLGTNEFFSLISNTAGGYSLLSAEIPKLVVTSKTTHCG